MDQRTAFIFEKKKLNFKMDYLSRFSYRPTQTKKFYIFKTNFICFSFQCHIFFNIGSVDSFEKNLYQTQEDLGIDPAFYIPVTYAKEVEWL